MARGTSALAALFLSLLALAAPAEAAPPANDAFSAAQPLAVGQEISGTNLEATAEVPNEPNPAGVTRATKCAAIDEAPDCTASVWYTFEPASSGEYTIETCDVGTDMDSVIGVYSGTTLTTLTEEKSNDDKCAGGYGGNGSQISFNATGATLYHVSVNGFDADEGSFYLRAYAGAPVARPEPDTGIQRNDGGGSFALAANAGGGLGVFSGPRHSASFVLTSSETGSSFECSLDGAAFAPCSSPASYDGLAPGSSHAFAARAVFGGVTDPTPVVERFTLDETPPDTFFTKAPLSEIAVPEAEWVSELTERNTADGVSPFRCGLDSQASHICGYARKSTELCKGVHEFRSAGWDRAGNVDPTPAISTVKVTGGPIACAPPTIGSPTVIQEEETEAVVEVSLEDQGAGGILHLEYGPTSAYGMTVRDESVDPEELPQTRGFGLPFLDPGTTYHYDIKLTTPFGTVATGDQTVAAKPLGVGDSVPVIRNLTPEARSEHAAAIPAEFETQEKPLDIRLLVSKAGPVTAASPVIESLEEGSIPSGLAAPVSRTFGVIDLDPSTTYHYRFAAIQDIPGGNAVLGPEGSFTTPPATPGAKVTTTVKLHFVLTRRMVKVGKLRRGARKLPVSLHGLPPKTAIRLRLALGKPKATAKGTAEASGNATIVLKLKAKLVAAIKKTRKKKLNLAVSVTPPEDGSSGVTVPVRLKPVKPVVKKHKHR